MKCPACGNEIADDVKNCPLCGKHIPVNLSKAGEQPASGQDAPRTDIAGGTLCPRCQTPLRPGAAFCENCGASSTGDGDSPENPCRDSGQNFGSKFCHLIYIYYITPRSRTDRRNEFKSTHSSFSGIT